MKSTVDLGDRASTKRQCGRQCAGVLLCALLATLTPCVIPEMLPTLGCQQTCHQTRALTLLCGRARSKVVRKAIARVLTVISDPALGAAGSV